MKTFRTTLRTPLQEIVTLEVLSASVDTELGRMMILPGHAPLTGHILFSKVKLVPTQGDAQEFYVKQGFVHVDKDNNLTEIMCLSCDPIEGVEIHNVTEYLAFIQEQLSKKESLSAYQIKFLNDEKVAFERQKQKMSA